MNDQDIFEKFEKAKREVLKEKIIQLYQILAKRNFVEKKLKKAGSINHQKLVAN
ncbi:MAG: hypothetical protein ABIM98_08700 [candidate division WOR-3 bacterium]